jgi:hypothetical protein
LSLTGRINGGESYSHELGEGLRVRFVPFNANWGWLISVGPESTEDYDWAWPLNPPFHTDNSQWLATGYGETAQSQMRFEHRIFFAVDAVTYTKAKKLVNDEVFNGDDGGAGRFLAALPTIPAGILRIKATNFDVSDEGKSVNWMEYSLSVIVPTSFHASSDLESKVISCPAMHWGSRQKLQGPINALSVMWELGEKPVTGKPTFRDLALGPNYLCLSPTAYPVSKPWKKALPISWLDWL